MRPSRDSTCCELAGSLLGRPNAALSRLRTQVEASPSCCHPGGWRVLSASRCLWAPRKASSRITRRPFIALDLGSPSSALGPHRPTNIGARPGLLPASPRARAISHGVCCSCGFQGVSNVPFSPGKVDRGAVLYRYLQRARRLALGNQRGAIPAPVDHFPSPVPPNHRRPRGTGSPRKLKNAQEWASSGSLPNVVGAGNSRPPPTRLRASKPGAAPRSGLRTAPRSFDQTYGVSRPCGLDLPSRGSSPLATEGVLRRAPDQSVGDSNESLRRHHVARGADLEGPQKRGQRPREQKATDM